MAAEKTAGTPLCRKSAPAGKRTRHAEKSYNGLSAVKQSKEKKVNAKSDVQKVSRKPVGLL